MTRLFGYAYLNLSCFRRCCVSDEVCTIFLFLFYTVHPMNRLVNRSIKIILLHIMKACSATPLNRVYQDDPLSLCMYNNACCVRHSGGYEKRGKKYKNSSYGRWTGNNIHSSVVVKEKCSER